MKRKRTATLRIMAVMASAMLGSSFYIFTTYAATIRHGVAAAVHAENGFGPGYVTVSEEAQTSAASGDTTSTYAVNDHKTVNANAATQQLTQSTMPIKLLSRLQVKLVMTRRLRTSTAAMTTPHR